MTDSSPGRKAAELFVACLENEGVTHLFGIPGEENLDMLEALRQSSIRVILTRHEQAAAIMAATCGRLTGQAAVALSTLGPGATNLVTGVAFAQLGGMPMVAITGQKPIKKSKQGRFQIIDVVRTMRPICKMAAQIPSVEKIPTLVREAFKLAEEERPGACHLELPEDIARETSSLTPIHHLHTRRPIPDGQAIAEAAQQLMAAKRPLLMIASGGNRARISTSLDRFIRQTGIPFFTTQMGKGVLDERQTECLGTAALTRGDYIHCAIERADLILSIGHDVTEKPPTLLGGDHATRVIHLNHLTAEIDDVYCPSLEVIGDIAKALDLLTDSVVPSPHWDFSYFYRASRECRQHIQERSDSEAMPILPQRLVHDLREVMPDDGILSLDNGMYKIWIARNYPAYQRNTVLLDNALATMGAGLPGAIAAKLIHPERQVAAICGDGGFMMNSQELETAIRLELNLVVVIVNDSGLGMIRWKQQEMGFPDFGLEFRNPDFVRYAESYGARGHRVAAAAEFAPLLRRCLASPGVHVIDLPVDYSENHRTLTEELQQKICLI